MGETRLEIPCDHLKLRGVLSTPETLSWPVVILCHGLFSHKDGSKYRQLAQVFADEGVSSLRFDFRGCGESEGLLAESTVSGRWRDLQSVIGGLATVEGFDGRFALLGSSLGGYLALLEASRNPQVSCVAAWSTPSHLDDLAERLPAVAPVTMSREFYDDLKRVEVVSRLGQVRKVLIMHGQQDQLVPPEHAYRLYAEAKEPKLLYVMNDADHRFSQPDAREQAIRHSLDWFRRHL